MFKKQYEKKKHDKYIKRKLISTNKIKLLNRTLDEQIKDYIIDGINMNDITNVMFSKTELLKVTYLINYYRKDYHLNNNHTESYLDDIYFPLYNELKDNPILFDTYYKLNDKHRFQDYEYEESYS